MEKKLFAMMAALVLLVGVSSCVVDDNPVTSGQNAEEGLSVEEQAFVGLWWDEFDYSDVTEDGVPFTRVLLAVDVEADHTGCLYLGVFDDTSDEPLAAYGGPVDAGFKWALLPDGRVLLSDPASGESIALSRTRGADGGSYGKDMTDVSGTNMNYSNGSVTLTNSDYSGTLTKADADKQADIEKQINGQLVGHPLTIEALTAGTVKVAITDYYGTATLSSGMKYSKNGGEKTLITTSTDIPVNAGDKVQFYGNGTSTQAYGSYPEVKIQGSGTGFTCKAYGNIMSLLDEGNYATKTDLPNVPRVFSGLFEGNTALTDAGDLLLPATTLATLCYEEMFNGCTDLTTAPKLPATTLASNCYYQMFGYCSALTTAPALPAETLASDCYTNMFFSCTALTTAPELPAKELAGSCYYQMFYGCTALTTAPDLRAPALVQNCYYGMFRNCTNLNAVRCLATSGVNENSSTEYWLEGAAATGTFHLASEARTAWSEGDNGIPSEWTGLYPDGSKWCLPHLLANVKAKDAGMLVGADGYIYDSNTSVAIAGTTAVAMIAYVGSETDNTTYTHGLAIALADDKGTGRSAMNWSDAMSTCAGKTAVSGGQWQLPSLNQWKTMFKANGGDDHSYTGLNSTITSAGGTALSADQKYYWTSTTEDAEHAWAWGYNMHGKMDYNNVVRRFYSYDVRAVLVF